MNSILSDYNRAGYSPSIARAIIYSDLDFNLRPLSNGAVKGDIAILTDIDAIKNSIRNLVLSGPYERPFQPELGSRLRFLLFENVNPLTALNLKEEIERVIRDNEPRVADIYVEVSDDSQNNAYRVTVHFAINNFNPQTVEFIINRIR